MPLGPGTSPLGLQRGHLLPLVKGAIVSSAWELAGAGLAHVALPEALSPAVPASGCLGLPGREGGGVRRLGLLSGLLGLLQGGPEDMF